MVSPGFTGLHAVALQRCGHAVYQRIERRVGKCRVALHQRELRRPVLSVLAHQISDCAKSVVWQYVVRRGRSRVGWLIHYFVFLAVYCSCILRHGALHLADICRPRG